MKAWDDSVTVTGTVRQEVHRHDLFPFLSLSPFKNSYPFFVDQCSVHSGDANKCNRTLFFHF